METKPCAAQHRPAWMDRADEALRLESQPPVPGAEPLGLMAPRLTSGEAVTGMNSGQHQHENRYRWRKTQENQPPASYWTSHEGNEVIPKTTKPPVEHVGGMCPSGLAIDHPAYEKLLEYATGGCPVKTGRDWTREEIHAAVARGPHVSALSTEALEHFAAESAEKVAAGYCRLVKWDDIKANPPSYMKVSPIAAIAHKSKAFRSILDLAFSLKLSPTEWIPSVNENTEKTAPTWACDPMGHVLQRVIHAFAQANEAAKIFEVKWDIKNGFWRMNCRKGEEFNFAYVLPQ